MGAARTAGTAGARVDRAEDVHIGALLSDPRSMCNWFWLSVIQINLIICAAREPSLCRPSGVDRSISIVGCSMCANEDMCYNSTRKQSGVAPPPPRVAPRQPARWYKKYPKDVYGLDSSKRRLARLRGKKGGFGSAHGVTTYLSV